ncbi:Hypothetical_protein [Hexamita inflata]|uniref:Hypothetical_protein n=1 Tax=Hexamita inflata TaxID=28002 RepID=A0AA86QE31_9EUKA|nr:Hypothetical protein HINF_LOCUS9625 [Hexamita inflata]CAI9944629.1 Hypothetical protein HINF_LOCUS32274 [Hexamita inflata]CAI9955101.1 Hypothetical protein HINF_LOCUS42746 [Hexamita inflata]
MIREKFQKTKKCIKLTRSRKQCQNTIKTKISYLNQRVDNLCFFGDNKFVCTDTSESNINDIKVFSFTLCSKIFLTIQQILFCSLWQYLQSSMSLCFGVVVQDNIITAWLGLVCFQKY